MTTERELRSLYSDTTGRTSSHHPADFQQWCVGRQACAKEKDAENKRVAEMDRRAMPIHWLVYVAAAAVCLFVILTQPI